MAPNLSAGRNLEGTHPPKDPSLGFLTVQSESKLLLLGELYKNRHMSGKGPPGHVHGLGGLTPILSTSPSSNAHMHLSYDVHMAVTGLAADFALHYGPCRLPGAHSGTSCSRASTATI
jgi:hypothetical protein